MIEEEIPGIYVMSLMIGKNVIEVNLLKHVSFLAKTPEGNLKWDFYNYSFILLPFCSTLSHFFKKKVLFKYYLL